MLKAYCKYVKTNYAISSVRLVESLGKLAQAHSALCGRIMTSDFDVISIILLLEYNNSEGIFEEFEKFRFESEKMLRILNSYV
jgi:hypothetical protein